MILKTSPLSMTTRRSFMKLPWGWFLVLHQDHSREPWQLNDKLTQFMFDPLAPTYDFTFNFPLLKAQADTWKAECPISTKTTTRGFSSKPGRSCL